MITRPTPPRTTSRARRLARRGSTLFLLLVLLITGSTVPAHADVGLTRLTWSANIGRIANVGPWVRNVNYALTASTANSGTVGAYFAQYDPTIAGTKTVIGYAGPCNGVASCPIYTATSSASGSWNGTLHLQRDRQHRPVDDHLVQRRDRDLASEPGSRRHARS